MRPRLPPLVALALVLAGCSGSVAPGTPTPTSQPNDIYAVGPMAPPCPSHGGADRTYHYPPTDRRSITVAETWDRRAEARRLAEAHVGRDVNLTAPDGRFDAVGWTGDSIDIQDRWRPERYRLFEAADGTDYAVLVLGYEDRTVLETFHVGGYC